MDVDLIKKGKDRAKPVEWNANNIKCTTSDFKSQAPKWYRSYNIIIQFAIEEKPRVFVTEKLKGHCTLMIWVEFETKFRYV